MATIAVVFSLSGPHIICEVGFALKNVRILRMLTAEERKKNTISVCCVLSQTQRSPFLIMQKMQKMQLHVNVYVLN